MAHYSIFRQELAISYPTYGNALWEPDPGGQYNAVEVGDVGFIRKGYFQRLFNVLLPKDHPSHRNPSFVPEDHQQLVTIPDHIVKNEIRTGSRQNSLHFCSQYVTLDSRGRGTSASGPEDDSQITFSCNGKQGALLSLPVPAQGEDTVAFGDFGKWMIKHIDTWFAFARGLGLGVNRMEDIILVTGRHLTKSWVNVAFTQRRPDAGVSFDVQVSGHSHVSLEQEYVRGGDLKLGPAGRDLPENQCIFIRGFRVVRILGMWPKLRAQAGPAPDADGQEPEAEPDPQLELMSFPDDDNIQDPLQDLLQYVAEQAPDCDMALVHDNDLACMDVARRTRTTLRTALRTNQFLELLQKSAPTIQQFQCELLSGNKNGPGADVAVAKVATLSEHAFETPRKGPDLNPVLTSGGATYRPTLASLPVISSVSTSSRPDRATYYDVEQKRIEIELGSLHEQLAVVNNKISDMAHVNESFTAVRAELEDLEPNITSRNQILNKISSTIQIKERSFQTGDSDDAADDDAIDAGHATLEKLKERLDDPEAKNIFERYNALKAKMKVMRKDINFLGNPSRLFEQQCRVQRQINTLFSERYDLISRLRKDDTEYYAMLNEDWYQRAERWSAGREPEIPVEDQIKDCQTLIEYFSGMSMTAKAGEEEEDYFVGTEDRSEFKKGPKAHSTTLAGKMSSSSSIDLSSDMQSTLHSMFIPPPSGAWEVPRVVENLKTRKAKLEEFAGIQQNLLEPTEGAKQ